MSLVVTPVVAPVTTAWQITPKNPADTMIALASIAQAGYTGSATIQGGTQVWHITLTHSIYPSITLYEYAWITFDGINARMYANNDDFIATYTANVPLAWSGVSTAPVAMPQSGGQAIITFPQPTSPNGPWTYSVSATNVTKSDTALATAVGQSKVLNGQVSLTVGGLALGADYTFTVSLTTQYGGSATSLVSNQITLPSA